MAGPDAGEAALAQDKLMEYYNLVAFASGADAAALATSLDVARGEPLGILMTWDDDKLARVGRWRREPGTPREVVRAYAKVILALRELGEACALQPLTAATAASRPDLQAAAPASAPGQTPAVSLVRRAPVVAVARSALRRRGAASPPTATHGIGVAQADTGIASTNLPAATIGVDINAGLPATQNMHGRAHMPNAWTAPNLLAPRLYTPAALVNLGHAWWWTFCTLFNVVMVLLSWTPIFAATLFVSTLFYDPVLLLQATGSLVVCVPTYLRFLYDGRRNAAIVSRPLKPIPKRSTLPESTYVHTYAYGYSYYTTDDVPIELGSDEIDFDSSPTSTGTTLGAAAVGATAGGGSIYWALTAGTPMALYTAMLARFH